MSDKKIKVTFPDTIYDNQNRWAVYGSGMQEDIHRGSPGPFFLITEEAEMEELSLSERVREFEKKYIDLNLKYNQLVEEKEKLSEQSASRWIRIQSLSAESNKLNSEIAKLMANYGAATTDNVRLIGLVKDLQLEVEALRSDKEKLSKANLDLIRQVLDLQAELSRGGRYSSNPKDLNKIIDLEDSIKGYATNVRLQEQAISELNKELDETKKLNRKLEAENKSFDSVLRVRDLENCLNEILNSSHGTGLCHLDLRKIASVMGREMLPLAVPSCESFIGDCLAYWKQIRECETGNPASAGPNAIEIDYPKIAEILHEVFVDTIYYHSHNQLIRWDMRDEGYKISWTTVATRAFELFLKGTVPIKKK